MQVQIRLLVSRVTAQLAVIALSNRMHFFMNVQGIFQFKTFMTNVTLERRTPNMSQIMFGQGTVRHE